MELRNKLIGNRLHLLVAASSALSFVLQIAIAFSIRDPVVVETYQLTLVPISFITGIFNSSILLSVTPYFRKKLTLIKSKISYTSLPFTCYLGLSIILTIIVVATRNISVNFLGRGLGSSIRTDAAEAMLIATLAIPFLILSVLNAAILASEGKQSKIYIAPVGGSLAFISYLLIADVFNTSDLSASNVAFGYLVSAISQYLYTYQPVRLNPRRAWSVFRKKPKILLKTQANMTFVDGLRRVDPLIDSRLSSSLPFGGFDSVSYGRFIFEAISKISGSANSLSLLSFSKDKTSQDNDQILKGFIIYSISSLSITILLAMIVSWILNDMSMVINRYLIVEQSWVLIIDDSINYLKTSFVLLILSSLGSISASYLAANSMSKELVRAVTSGIIIGSVIKILLFSSDHSINSLITGTSIIFGVSYIVQLYYILTKNKKVLHRLKTLMLTSAITIFKTLTCSAIGVYAINMLSVNLGIIERCFCFLVSCSICFHTQGHINKISRRMLDE